MADHKQTTETNESQDEKTSRIKDFVSKHPRALRVAGITAGVATVVGVIAVAKNRNADAGSTDDNESLPVLTLDPATQTYKVEEA